jgi:hypothetical protein
MNQLRLKIRLGTDPKIIAIAVLATCGYFCCALFQQGPVAVPDVPDYLSIAQWIYGGLLLEQNNFSPGYGLFLIPVGWLSGDSLHTAALLFNSCLAGGSILLVARLAYAFGLSKKLTVSIAAIAAICPSVAGAALIAWPEILITTVLLLVANLLAVGSPRCIKWSGFLAGSIVSVHPRAVTLAIAFVALAFIYRWWKPLAYGLLPGAVVTALLLTWTHTWPQERITAIQDIGEGPSPLAVASGQAIAIFGASGGLALVGLLAGLSSLCRTRRHKPDNATVEFIALSGTGMIILGALALAGSDRSDTLLYSRYMEPWLLPLVVVGLMIVTRNCLSRRSRFLGLLSMSGALVCVLSSSTEVSIDARQIMTLSLSSVWKIFDANVNQVAIFSFCLGFIGLLLARKKSGLRYSAALVIIFSVALPATILNQIHLYEVGKVANGQTTMAISVDLEEKCLSYDSKTVKNYAPALYRLQLPKISHRMYDLETGDKPCGRYIIAGSESNVMTSCKGSVQLGEEPRASWGLWTYPVKGCKP